jgi:malate dehydrogenase (oxaloacetate-decarboxylating)
LARGRAGMNAFKDEIAARTNPERYDGSLADVMEGADVFIGVSAPGCVTVEMVQSMASGAIVFAMSNPVPEIAPDAARAGGAVVIATGRSDYPNQVNNSVAFPGIFRGALDVRARGINDAMKIAAAEAIASLVTEDELRPDYILPKSLDLRVPSKVASAVARVAMETGMARITVDAQRVEQNTRDLIYEGLIAAV